MLLAAIIFVVTQCDELCMKKNNFSGTERS